MIKLVFVLLLVTAAGYLVWLYRNRETPKTIEEAEDALKDLKRKRTVLEKHEEIVDETNELLKKKEAIDEKAPEDDSKLNNL